MPRYLLALDQGTTSSRALVFDEAGETVALAQKALPPHFPQPGWVEHDPEEIWQTQLSAARSALTEAGIAPSEIAAVGVANQRETTLVWDRKTGQPIYPAIVWQDRRTAETCARLKAEGNEPWVRERTGLVLDSYFSATKAAWILDQVSGARSLAENGQLAFGTVDTWLIWKLTEGRVHATDPSNASRTLLFDLRKNAWSKELCELFGVPMAMLPEVLPSAGHFGATTLFGSEMAIGGVAGDQQAATFGQACFRAGSVKNTYGTGCFLLMNTGEKCPKPERGLLATLGWQLGSSSPTFALEGSVFVAGAAVQWLRDELGLLGSAAESEAIATEVRDNAGVYLVPAFTGLGAPHWDPRARGTLVGLTRGTTKSHLVRAALESIAYQAYDVVRLFPDLGNLELKVDGGASRNDFLMQFQADVLGIPVVRPAQVETTALGAAYLAGLTVGVFGSCEELAALWKAERTFDPRMSRDEAEGKLAGWRRAVDCARSWSRAEG